MSEELSDELPIPPLDPTWYADHAFPGGFGPELRPFEPGRYVQRDVIFRLREHEYIQRMQHEALRLRRERDLERALAEKTETIKRLARQIEDLQTMKRPTVVALREAYAEGKITLEEFERLVLHCIGGES